MRSINGLTFFVRVKKFQSPRSGKFVSNFVGSGKKLTRAKLSFNPLDRGNLYLIQKLLVMMVRALFIRFNPLDRGNLYLI